MILKHQDYQHLLWILLLIGGVMSCQPRSESTSTLTTAQVICRTQPIDKAWYSSGQKAALFDSLGELNFPITTRSQEAQRYFNQGLMLAAGFNHAEAARSFYEAIRLDSTCAMAYWGFSYVLGPNYNAGMEADNYERAYKAIQQARQLSSNGTAKEKALINALAKRYSAQPVEDRKPYDVAYSQAMEQVHKQFPDDADVAALYAESLMDLHPWDLWERDGTPKPWTPAIVTTLEKLLQQNPNHIALNHYYIHAVEASQTPERGLKSAEILSKVAPKASHLVHMPSHIYIRTGHYHEGSLSNWKAVKADSLYLMGEYAQGAFPLSYFPHNYHFLVATATLEGNYQWAMNSAQQLAANTQKTLMANPSWSTLQHYYTIPYHVAIKFGQWDELLNRCKADTVQLKYPTAIRHYARGMALVGKQQIAEAKLELQQLDKLTNDPSIASLTIWSINSMHSILEIARRVLKAEILAHERQFPASIKLLEEAVHLEDQLNYNEPPDWFFSVRHHLGLVLQKANRYQEAEAIFAKDLSQFPRNGWALSGIYKAQVSQGQREKAKQTLTLLEEALKWANAEVKAQWTDLGINHH
ncbi:tetratricopeptide (TPR) repeat protein [Runella defluvii]|uniref:Tetratricopeptide (TPR) repeat protein n=1 Tax=Runella defluvii TaxID=370973 RepID=A0A7W6ESU0_9BACT|nr:tetratricopeptide repeat protein [Runella defluvii]MBB3841003.1 tetratricopeptide (TPR) repeat protein [Runella defluvii]